MIRRPGRQAEHDKHAGESNRPKAIASPVSANTMIRNGGEEATSISGVVSVWRTTEERSRSRGRLPEKARYALQARGVMCALCNQIPKLYWIWLRARGLQVLAGTSRSACPWGFFGHEGRAGRSGTARIYGLPSLHRVNLLSGLSGCRSFRVRSTPYVGRSPSVFG